MKESPPLSKNDEGQLTTSANALSTIYSVPMATDGSTTESPFAARAATDAPAKGTSNANPPPPSRRWGWIHKILRPQMDTTLDFSFIVLCIVGYGVLFFSMGKVFLPGHPAWCTLLLWASSLVGAFIAHQLYLPRVIGMLGAGILLINVPWAAIDAFPPRWGSQMRAGALATIFLRCGLELDFGTMKRFKYPAIRLALIPGLAEALFDAGLGVALFNMSYTLGLCMGFILKAVGPGLVVPAMFRLQKANIGTDQGIPSTVVISASFDDVVAITGYAIFSTIAIQSSNGSSTNAAWDIASGPCQVIFGILGGVLAGFAMSATKIWNTHPKRFIALYGSGLLLMYFLNYWSLLSGGALGALFAGLVGSNLWEKGIPKRLALATNRRMDFSPDCERTMSVIWRWIMEPILFVTVGSTLDFSKITKGTIPKSVAIVCAGVTVRMILTFFCMSGFKYTTRERLFYALAWTPKATVQAALSAAPLTLIKSLKQGAPDYNQWVEWGNDILTTGLFAIIICGTLGVLAIHFSAPVLLKTAAVKSSDGESTDGEDRNGANELPGTVSRDPFSSGGADAVRMPSVNVADHRQGSLDDQMRVGPGALSIDALKRNASTDTVPNSRPGSPTVPVTHLTVTGEDFDLLADYIDAVQKLTLATQTGEREGPEMVLMSARVVDLQRRIEEGVARKEPSVRELFRTASLRGRRPMRAASRASVASRSGTDLPSSRHNGGGTGYKSAEDAV